MPLYMIERTFADQLDLTSDDVRLIEEINSDEGVRWLFSFLSADRRRTYCLYEAPSPEAIVAAAAKANVPVDSVVEVGAEEGEHPAHALVGVDLLDQPDVVGRQVELVGERALDHVERHGPDASSLLSP